MKLVLTGYGRMGHLIKQKAVNRGHEIVLTIDPASEDADIRSGVANRDETIGAIKNSGAEGIIDFSTPAAIVGNLRNVLPLRLPIVVGTTGWKADEASIAALVSVTGGSILRSANFSLGVNLFFRVVSEAARIFADFDDYDVAVWEGHHNQKADSPSGTAMEIARRILAENKRKTSLVTGEFKAKPQPEALHVSSTRIGSFPGTHTVFFDSTADTIELTHVVRNREGLALGAVYAMERFAEALRSGRLKQGKLYGLEDVW
ncbi:MAG: 4-hydroxy-tetrahydrodipicolinate reductase [Treponema sp.]|nr:4-hydroxy-tetrahydrodipicolinate reductase [Treponema sp.]